MIVSVCIYFSQHKALFHTYSTGPRAKHFTSCWCQGCSLYLFLSPQSSPGRLLCLIHFDLSAFAVDVLFAWADLKQKLILGKIDIKTADVCSKEQKWPYRQRSLIACMRESLLNSTYHKNKSSTKCLHLEVSKVHANVTDRLIQKNVLQPQLRRLFCLQLLAFSEGIDFVKLPDIMNGESIYLAAPIKPD